ncbi:MAG: bifunctional phosphoglucose/phosphomannose isomerase [Candidatus Omnitrophica bacterium]|nr:bifunctional phosphoglucose/phosphomannose isomerase [Candidatus Omnitrophota bacterium]
MLKLIKRFDNLNMLPLLQDFPAQCKDSYLLGEEIKIPPTYHLFKYVVFCGMGGSAIGGDIIRAAYLYRIKFPIFVIKNYSLPNFVDEETLFFVCSYSGNTEETISAYQEAKKRRAKIIVISSGGILRELAEKDASPFVKIPPGYPPRQALAYFVFTPLKILEKINILPNLEPEWQETISLLEKLRDKNFSPEVKKGNFAWELAQLLKNKFPVIYGQIDYLEAVCARWRAQLAENSKVLSSIHFFPEMNHNEIVGWRFPEAVLKKFFIIFLRDNQEQERIERRIEVTKEIFSRDGFKFKEVRAEGNFLLARIFSLIYLGDYVSYYLALLNRVDPTPVEPIVYLKNKLSDNKV